MHLLIQGLPASGKTKLIKEILPEMKNKRGFYTEEIREAGQRVGFKVIRLDKKEAVFAHKDFDTPHKVSRYSVKLDLFDAFATEELSQAIKSDCEYIVIDEIGKMELLSARFQEVCNKIFESKKVLGTIPIQTLPFIQTLKKRDDTCTFNLTKNNFCYVKEKLLMAIATLEVDQMRALEKKAKEIGLDERVLIENASSNLFSTIDSLDCGQNALIVAGRGNNGADVLSCARKLLSSSYNIDVVIINDKQLNEECQFQLDVLRDLGVHIYLISNQSQLTSLRKLLADKDFILEGILGIGVKGELPLFLKEVIKELNASTKRIISCDLPSGLNPDTGHILGQAVFADITISFIAPKRGFFLEDGPRVCGKIYVVDIGVSRELLERI